MYALFRRKDAGFWHAIAGGGEDDETPIEAAMRETREESGISASSFIRLDSVFSIPVTHFKDSHLWGEEVYVIPQYCFGVSVECDEIHLSAEHTEYGWFEYDDAFKLVEFESSKIALWELDRRLRGLGPRG